MIVSWQRRFQLILNWNSVISNIAFQLFLYQLLFSILNYLALSNASIFFNLLFWFALDVQQLIYKSPATIFHLSLSLFPFYSSSLSIFYWYFVSSIPLIWWWSTWDKILSSQFCGLKSISSSIHRLYFWLYFGPSKQPTKSPTNQPSFFCCTLSGYEHRLSQRFPIV